MAYVGEFEIDTKIIAALQAESDVTDLVGSSPMRVYTRTPRTVTLPFVRMTTIEATPLTGVMTGSGIDWARRTSRQFSAFSQSTSAAEVSNIQKAIIKVMDRAPDTVVGPGDPPGWVVFMVIPGTQIARYDVENGTWVSITEFVLSID